MKLEELVNKLSLEVLSNKDGLKKDIEGGYVSDMLSDVMANSNQGDIWITLQTHPNIVAVASLKNLSGIIIASKRKPEQETLKKAVSENITILTTRLTAFEVSGKIYQLLE
jgi:serine kinase of HPr protein (carbohydrate metabolism regulator)